MQLKPLIVTMEADDGVGLNVDVRMTPRARNTPGSLNLPYTLPMLFFSSLGRRCDRMIRSSVSYTSIPFERVN